MRWGAGEEKSEGRKSGTTTESPPLYTSQREDGCWKIVIADSNFEGA
jgi:hypothetical protein